jgi:hypothetical protein
MLGSLILIIYISYDRTSKIAINHKHDNGNVALLTLEAEEFSVPNFIPIACCGAISIVIKNNEEK